MQLFAGLGRAVVLAVFGLVGAAGVAQGTLKDSERARQFQEAVKDKLLNAADRAAWKTDGSACLYRTLRPGGVRAWVLVRVPSGEQVPAFDTVKLAKALGAVLGRALDPGKLPIEEVTFQDKGILGLKAENSLFTWDPQTSALEGPKSPEAPLDEDQQQKLALAKEARSLDGNLIALVQDCQVVVKRVKEGTEVFRSHDGTIGDLYTGEFHWSPDSRRLVAVRGTKVEQRKVTIVEAAPGDQFQPKVHTFDYAKPGDPLPCERPQLFDAATGRQLPVQDDLAPNPYEITRIRWSEDSSRFTYLFNQRGHQLLRVIAVDGATGASRTLVEERSATFIDYSDKTYLEFMDARHELVWMSERSGWNHLYLIDADTGVVKNPVTQGAWPVNRVVRLDAKEGKVIFEALGLVPGQDPYDVHLVKANLDGSALKVLTEGNGTHATLLSPDGRYFLDAWSRVDLPPTGELRRVADGALLKRLEQADATDLVKAGWHAPEIFTAKGRDRVTDIWGVIHRPSRFDPKRRYPVIEYIYAGPHGHFAPKTFRPWHSAQYYAELGFIVVQMDGMGTNGRSRAFHDVACRNLGDSGFPDRILWIKAAAARHREMDLGPGVGIYGGSAGGQSALRALLVHGDFYKVAVSDCGCHDNRMDKIWWNEQWMGWPIGPHYAEQSNVTQACNLQGHLLLTVAELDRNVDPASTLQVVDALIKADKDFELIVLPGADHFTLENPYIRRRAGDFFVRYLQGVEPRR